MATAKQIEYIMKRLAANKIDPKRLLDRLETLQIPRDVNSIPFGSVDEVLKWIDTANKPTQAVPFE
jgi:hypothetical protein